MEAFNETLPEAVSEKLGREGPEDEPALIQVSSDLSSNWQYGRQWLVVTEKRLVVVPGDGEDGTVVVPMAEVAGVRTEELVGGGCLVVDRRGEGPLYLPYSQSLIPKFAEVAEGIR